MTLEELQLHEQLAKAMIKIHNLHIALNKKVEKNKNQALEITKLLKDKKIYEENRDNIGELLQTNNKQIRWQEIKLNELQSNLDYKNEALKQLINDKDNLKNKVILLEQQVENTNNELARVCELNKYLKEAYEIKLQEKNTIISYLESKLK